MLDERCSAINVFIQNQKSNIQYRFIYNDYTNPFLEPWALCLEPLLNCHRLTKIEDLFLYLINYGLISNLTLPETYTKSATRIAPINGLVFAGNTTGPAFQTSLPGKNNLLLLQDVILDRTDIKTGFIPAGLAK